MEVLSMTDKQWKGWLGRFERSQRRKRKTEETGYHAWRNSTGLRRLSREGGLATALHQKKYNKYGISCK